MSTLERARKLVCDMNPFEAIKLNLLERSVEEWPEWAQRDLKLACDAMTAIREETMTSRDNYSLRMQRVIMAENLVVEGLRRKKLIK